MPKAAAWWVRPNDRHLARTAYRLVENLRLMKTGPSQAESHPRNQERQMGVFNTLPMWYRRDAISAEGGTACGKSYAYSRRRR
jgi:hypothetical protein